LLLAVFDVCPDLESPKCPRAQVETAAGNTDAAAAALRAALAADPTDAAAARQLQLTLLSRGGRGGSDGRRAAVAEVAALHARWRADGTAFPAAAGPALSQLLQAHAVALGEEGERPAELVRLPDPLPPISSSAQKKNGQSRSANHATHACI
jgi:hypothetical protein